MFFCFFKRFWSFHLQTDFFDFLLVFPVYNPQWNSLLSLFTKVLGYNTIYKQQFLKIVKPAQWMKVCVCIYIYIWVYMLHIYSLHLGSSKGLKLHSFSRGCLQSDKSKPIWDLKFVSIKSCIEEKTCNKCDRLFIGIYWESA